MNHLVKISSPDGVRNPDLREYLGNNVNRINNTTLAINDPSANVADAWLIIDDLAQDSEECMVPGDCVGYLSSETFLPPMALENPDFSSFLDQFAAIYSCHPVFRANASKVLPFQPWMINANHGTFLRPTHRDIHWLSALSELPKPHEISVFCSDKCLSDEHRLRLRFVEELKHVLGDRLHWFGNGINPLPEKWLGIAPYRYHLAIENTSRPDFITEKLYDSFLGLAYPIYSGAPNVETYFPGPGITRIDISNPNRAIAQILSVLDEDPYTKTLPNLLDARDRVLSEFNAFRRIGSTAEQLIHQSSQPQSHVQLFSRARLAPPATGTGFRSLAKRARSRLSSLSNGLRRA